jgi:hypothetical protein
MRKVIIALLMLMTTALALTCKGDHSPPSPHLILLKENVLKIEGLSDPCKVAKLEVIIVKNNKTSTVFSTNPNAVTVNAVVTLNARPPFTLTVSYEDGAGNPGSLTWVINNYPYITYTLEQMIVQGTKAVVMVNPPPAKPALPPEFGEVSYQTSVWFVMALLGFGLGFIRYLMSRRSP